VSIFLHLSCGSYCYMLEERTSGGGALCYLQVSQSRDRANFTLLLTRVDH